MSKPEYWLRGPVEKVPELLQPVAHALLQCRDEIHEMMANFPNLLLWETPNGVASPAFHLQHLAGVLNRLFAYAKGLPLSENQLQALSSEGKFDAEITVDKLLKHIDDEWDAALNQLRHTDPGTLTEKRMVGRKQLPSTVIGLLFHAAEHSMRHTGQLLVTVRLLEKRNG